MSLEIEDGETADVTQSIDVHGEFAEEVDDSRRTVRKSVPEDEGRDNDREDLLNEEGDLHLEELTKRAVHLRVTASARENAGESEMTDLGGVQLSSPFERKVMSELDDLPHHLLRIHHLVLVRHHPSSNSQYRSEYSNVEEYSPSRRDFEMEERVGIDD